MAIVVITSPTTPTTDANLLAGEKSTSKLCKTFPKLATVNSPGIGGSVSL